MARWYKLEMLKEPISWKHGHIDRVLHVWQGKSPPTESGLPPGSGRLLALLFKEDLLRRLNARSSEPTLTAEGMPRSERQRFGRGKPQPR